MTVEIALIQNKYGKVEVLEVLEWPSETHASLAYHPRYNATRQYSLREQMPIGYLLHTTKGTGYIWPQEWGWIAAVILRPDGYPPVDTIYTVTIDLSPTLEYFEARNRERPSA